MKDIQADWLLQEILFKTQQGFSCLPIIGAGFSAPSGAPLVTDLQEYLQGCICAALGLDDLGPSPEGFRQSWHPRTDAWPQPISLMQPQRSHWENLLFQKISDLRGLVNKLREGPTSNKPAFRQESRILKLYSEALGAMQDWRTSLLFLSRLVKPDPRDDNLDMPLTLTAPRAEVVDRFFREVLSGKKPSLGHRMLGAVAPALGIDIVLTTNFDDLLEKGFAAAGNPLDVFEVPSRGYLPELAAISNQNTLIKLHGGRTSLRADYSLDDTPSDQDIATFLDYLRSTPKNQPGSYIAKKYILLIGFAGGDERIRYFVRKATTELADPSRNTVDVKMRGCVYWLCYTDTDKDELLKHFPKEIAENFLIPVRSTRTDLFFLELYQRLHQALPPLGGIFPSVSRTALPSSIPPRFFQDQLPGLRSLPLSSELSTAVENSESQGPHIIICVAETHSHGLVSLCTEEFERNEGTQGRVPIWIDMNDVSSAIHLFEVLVEVVQYKLGVEEWIPSATTKPQGKGFAFESQARELNRLLRTLNKRWVVFLNGRETPGANVYEQFAVEHLPANGWLDWINSEYDSATFGDFAELVNAIAKVNTRVTFVLLVTDHPESVISRAASWAECGTTVIPYGSSSNLFDRDLVWTECEKWLGSGKEDERPLKLRFLIAMVIMQRPRFPAAFWSSAYWQNDINRKRTAKERNDLIIDWVNDLEAIGLLRRKAGGMIGLLTTCRTKLRDELCRPRPKIGEIHFDVACWYEGLVDASEAPGAVFEAAYHFARAAECFLAPSVNDGGDNQSYAYLSSRASAALEAAAAKIRSEGFLIQTHGQSRGSCRELERLADVGLAIWDKESLSSVKGKSPKLRLRNAIETLWITCAESMLCIAREVGEDGRAYYRQKQVGYLLNGWSWRECKQMEMITDSNQRELLRVKSTQRSLTQELLRAVSRGNRNKPIASDRRAPRARLWRWFRWNVMLATASRSYHRVMPMLHGYGTDSKIFPTTGILGTLEQQIDGSFEREKLSGQRERIEFLRLIEEASQLHLLEFSLASRSGNSTVDLTKLLAATDALILRGLRLASKIRDGDKSLESSESRLAVWCEARLLMHLSVVHARSGEVNYIAYLHRDPLGILSNAEAKLRVASSQRIRAESALIDLHRAEARLRSADLKSVHLELFRWRSGTMPGKNRLTESEAARGRVAVAQAIGFLDSAEPILRERRRNVWWTTWFCERKLKAIAVSILLSCDSFGEAVPFLGLAASMRATETEADRLLLESQRMIRIDAYRFATVLDAYVDCLFALVAKLQMDKDSTRLPIRLKSMLTNIRASRKHLNEVFKARVLAGDLDPQVDSYVRDVLARTQDDLKHVEFAAALQECMQGSRHAGDGVLKG